MRPSRAWEQGGDAGTVGASSLSLFFFSFPLSPEVGRCESESLWVSERGYRSRLIFYGASFRSQARSARAGYGDEQHLSNLASASLGLLNGEIPFRSR
ncbi:hypothetical protein chiPu_0000427 [Chiloscyllium punctatum]|uniref:Uncharacterized protein n=1 Tax=Chiloscyllium punctatum TaxID=137246 RepID=A0A401RV94_CHIPU|nr:hypothetical protein [Chiloscyllium punctatum]